MTTKCKSAELTKEEFAFLYIFFKYYRQYVNHVVLKSDPFVGDALWIVLNEPLTKDGQRIVNIPCTPDMPFSGLEPDYQYSIYELGFTYFKDN